MAKDHPGVGTPTGLRIARRSVPLAIACAVVALHALLLGRWPLGAGERWRSAGPGAGAALQVREIPLAPPSEAPPAGTEAVDTEPRAAPPVPRGAPARDRAPVRGPEVPARRADPPPNVVAPTAPAAMAAMAPLEAEGESPPILASDPGGRPPPRYPTRPAPPVTLGYELQRGPVRGEGRLEWRHDGERYELALLGHVSGTELLGWTSRGGFDGGGLAPERFVVRRRARELAAANFRRDSGRITFSGPAIELPLPIGTQDRISWLPQLAAILEAGPALGTPGESVTLLVVGTRGDAEAWTFEVRGLAPLELPAGRVEAALHLVREPQRPYDVQVEAWLDPARHHLPLRLRLRAQPSGESTDFLLRALNSQ